jgi:hypothetical protein
MNELAYTDFEKYGEFGVSQQEEVGKLVCPIFS